MHQLAFGGGEADAALAAALRAAVRDVPDFPKPGILFKDITPLLARPELLGAAVGAMSAPFREVGVTHVAAIESRGFILGAPIALSLGCALVPMRKLGKLPYHTERIDYALEYGTAALEVHADAFGQGARVLVVDDVLATGGTAEAGIRLARRMGANVVGATFLIALDFLGGERRLDGCQSRVLLRYQG